jgi:ectoine hydroxylase-related dioxygenase (phytanoyl-CoA dioxygenase family)
VADSANAGYGIFSNVWRSDEVAALATTLAQADLDRSRAGARHLLTQPAVAALARDPRMLAIARQFLHTEPFPFRATLFDKSAQSNWLVVWHQDTALPLRERRDIAGWGPWSIKGGVTYAHAPASALSRIIALRMHLDDSGADNGPLRVLPRTHTLGLLSDEAIAEIARTAEPIDCLVDAGGVIAMRPLLLHASSKARSDRVRRVIHIEYADSPILGDGLELALA